MSHIHTNPGHIDQTVTAYIVRTDGDEPRVLLHMHRKHGKLLPPGGHIELDETPWAAMSHEIKEETGYTLRDLRVLQPPLRIRTLPYVMLHPQPLVVQTHNITPEHFHTDSGYLFIAEYDPLQQPKDGESTDLRWLARQEVIDAPESLIFDNTRMTALAIFDEFLSAWEAVPAESFSTELPDLASLS